jgi:hypothetical protein
MADTPAEPAQAEPKGQFRQAKPNPQFPPEITYLLRFYVAAKGEKLPPCPVCNKKTRGRWTMLCPFRAFTMGTFKVEPAGEFAPLTLVCSDHFINPAQPIMEALDPR